MGFPSHLIELLKNLYSEQCAAVRTGHDISVWFEISKGVRQACVLSPPLFNTYAEWIMWEALDDVGGTVSIGGRKYSNLRHAYDMVLLAESIEDMQDLLDRVRKASEESGLYLNVSKMKLMVIEDVDSNNTHNISLTANGLLVDKVTQISYLGVLVNDQCDDSPEIRRRIAIAKNATVSLLMIWKDKAVRTRTKVRLLWSLVFLFQSQSMAVNPGL